jgi:hypothetical protein
MLWVIFIIRATFTRTSASSADLKHYQLTLLLYQFRFMNGNSSKKLCSIVLFLKWPWFLRTAYLQYVHIKLGKSDIICWHVESSCVMRSILSIPILTFLWEAVWKYRKFVRQGRLWAALLIILQDGMNFLCGLFCCVHTHTHTHFTNPTCVNWQLNMKQVKIKKSH